MSKKLRYVPKEETKQELLDLLYTKEGVSKIKARQLIFYGVPMSLIRWARYLTVDEMSKYLSVEDETQDETSGTNKEDLGI